MTEQTETRDRELGWAIQQIPVPALQIRLPTDAAPIASNLRSRRARRFRRQWTIAAAVIVAAAATVGALFVAGVIGSRPAGSNAAQALQAFLKAHPQLAQQREKRQEERQQAWERIASRSLPGSTGVRTLLAYTRAADTVQASDLPAKAAELLEMQESFGVGQTPTSIQEPIVGDPSTDSPSIYLVFYPDNLCQIIATDGGADGSCYDALRLADGSLSVNDSIVDGKRYVHGLVANDVTSVTVSLAAAGSNPPVAVPATIENNVFIAPLPYNGGYTLGGITATITRSDGTSATVQLPGLPGSPPAKVNNP